MTRFRGSSIRETKWTDVTDAGCPANQHTYNGTRVSTRVFPSSSAPHELCTKLIQAVYWLGFHTQRLKHCPQLVRLRESLATTSLSTTTAENSWPRFHKSWIQPTLSTTSAETRPASLELEITTRSYGTANQRDQPPQQLWQPQYHDTTICPTHQTTIPRELTEALANKTRLHWAQEGPLLNQRKRHAKVLVRRETNLMKMWHVECRLVSCMLQWCSSWQYGYMCQLAIVL